MERDIPSVVAEVSAAFEAYEEALVANDVDRILGFFTEDAVRSASPTSRPGWPSRPRGGARSRLRHAKTALTLGNQAGGCRAGRVPSPKLP